MDQINTIAKTSLMGFKDIDNSNNDTLKKIRLHTNLISTNKMQCEQLIIKSLSEGKYQDSLNAMMYLCFLAGLNLNDMIKIAVSEFEMSDTFQNIPTFSSCELPTSMQDSEGELLEDYSISSEVIRDFVINYLKMQERNKFVAEYNDVCQAFEDKYGSQFTEYEKTVCAGEKSPRWKRRISNLSRTWDKLDMITRPKRGTYKLSEKLILEHYQ